MSRMLRALLVLSLALWPLAAGAITYAPSQYTTAQSDTVLVSIPTGQIIRLYGFSFMVSAATTPNVGFILECDDTADVRIDGHPGLAPGSGYVRTQDALPIVECGDGQDLLLTADVPTSGAMSISIQYDTVG